MVGETAEAPRLRQGPRNLTVKGNNEIVLKNILVGDVWICSGQSNMEWPLAKCTKTPKEAAAAQKNNKQLRLFRIPDHVKAPEPAPDTKGTWKTTELEQDCLVFSGCGFFFGAKLQKELDIPIGLIDTSWGGTPVDQWISNKAHQTFSKATGRKASTTAWSPRWCRSPSREPSGIRANRTVAMPSRLLHQDGRPHHRLARGLPGRRFPVLPGANRAPSQYNKKQPGDDETLARNIWAAQYKAAKEIKNCGIVPIHDTLHGVINDIHPWDKKPVAERLAKLALKKDYGKDVAWTGPEFASAKASGGKIIVSFQGIDQGLTTTDGKEARCFEIAGADKVFVPAKATIQGDTVVVGAEGVASPKHVKMGWNETQVPNLADKNGWPVFQFPPWKRSRRGGKVTGIFRLSYSWQLKFGAICPRGHETTRPGLHKWAGSDRAFFAPGVTFSLAKRLNSDIFVTRERPTRDPRPSC
jgi:sialate O-acetylesterase